MATITREKMEEMASVVNQVQGELNRAQGNRANLRSQLTENEVVMKEFGLLEEGVDGKVFKLVGPLMMEQALGEAKSNVSKRIDFISGEIKRADDAVARLEKKSETTRMALLEGQQIIMKMMQAQQAKGAPGPQ